MNDQNRKPNDLLRRQRELRGWSMQNVVKQVQELESSAGISADMIGTWERGEHLPRPFYRELLCRIYGTTADQLGFINLDEANRSSSSDLVIVNKQQVTFVLALQELLASALAGKKTMAAFDSSRRALILEGVKQLLGITSAVTLLEAQGGLNSEELKGVLAPVDPPTEINENLLSQFSTLNEVAWALSRGNHLDLAQRTLLTFLPQLRALVRQPSKHQQTLTYLAVQTSRLSGILALHRNDLVEREKYYKEAVQYSQQYGQITNDYNLHVLALKGLAGTYYYSNQPLDALQTFQKAYQYIGQISPLLQASIYMDLGMTSAQCGLADNALKYMGLACDNFPNSPERDPNFSYADFDSHQMILWEGLTRLYLGKPKDALNVFERINSSKGPTSERIRIEVINHTAHAAVLVKNLEMSRAYVIDGVTGAKALNSQRRYNEISNVYKIMQIVWPHEKLVEELTELFQ